jgi:SAM-dependent methyltransferase
LARTREQVLADWPDQYHLWVLVLASFLVLFGELAFIRWLAVEVRVFAYFKNLALLVCFLGFGLGCALASRPVRWWMTIIGTMALLLAVRVPLPQRDEIFEHLSTALGGAGDLSFWVAQQAAGGRQFTVASVVALLLLLLLVMIFIPLGQIVSRQMDLAPRALPAYSWNLAGSLGGILAFFLVCRWMMPPVVWLVALLGGMAMLYPRGLRLTAATLVLPALLLLHDPNIPGKSIFWTPYQQIDIQRMHFPDGEFRSALISVNHTGYQWMVNLSPAFLSRHPGLLQQPRQDHPYNLPYRFARPAPEVLILGAGNGNDAAAALRNGSPQVDAVEIDPAIRELGLREHPEHPYESSRVTLHLTDARAFLKRTRRQYDLIIYGFLDSHTQFSDYSNMRIDNFVYTEESFLEARRHLRPDGVIFVQFEVNRPWMRQRLAAMLTKIMGQPPLVFFAPSSYGVGGTCFVASASHRVELAMQSDAGLAQLVRAGAPPHAPPAPIILNTDDWPYLYHQGRWIPATFYALGALLLALALGLYTTIPQARAKLPSLFFFSMGAGFLLLETQTISRLALYFGTTWQVNGIVIAAVLATLLVANMVAQRHSSVLRRSWLFVGLMGGLLAAYLLPFERSAAPAAAVGTIMALVFAVPVFFAGLLFASEFRNARSPSAALGANMIGAVVGGLLENLSFIFGMKALLLVAMVVYACAAAGAMVRRSERSRQLADRPVAALAEP